MKVGVVIPAYNVGDSISFVLSKVIKYVPKKNIYVVDDGSTDSTTELVNEKGVILSRHGSNKGKGEALKSGFRLALEDSLEGIFTLDGDGQHDPDYIPDFIDCMETDSCDIVIGIRCFRIGEMPIDRIFSNCISSIAVSILSGQWIPDSQCGYRLIRTAVLKNISLFSNYYEIETELLVKSIWNGYKISYCPISLKYDDYRSHIHRFTDTKRFCRLLLKMIKSRQYNKKTIE